MRIYLCGLIGLIGLAIGGTLVPLGGFGQKLLQSSAKTRPDWLQYSLPEPTNNTFDYRNTEGEGSTLNQARESCLLELSTYVRQDLQIAKEVRTKILFDDQGEQMNSVFLFEIQGEPLRITVSKKDEYWEVWKYPDGRSVYRCHTLYAVAKKPGVGKMDELRFDGKYGARGMWRSMLVPGWGQLYKGSRVKGGCILGGEVLLVGGIIVGENLRAGYIRKAQETLNVDFRRDYVDRADNWRNIRNICIGGAAALYLYSVIDAIVAPGMRRTTVRRFTLTPGFSPEMNGITLGYRF